MSTAMKGGQVFDPTHSVGRVRVACDVAQRWLSLLGVVLCVAQIGFAALGLWLVALNGVSESGPNYFAAHSMDGTVLQYLAVVLLILGVIARSGWKAWVLPLVMAVGLFVVQDLLVMLGFVVSPWFGFLHAVVGTLIAGGFLWLMIDRGRAPLSLTE